jgi:hypothetical protein
LNFDGILEALLGLAFGRAIAGGTLAPSVRGRRSRGCGAPDGVACDAKKNRSESGSHSRTEESYQIGRLFSLGSFL